jgi:hypothetical protein
LLRGAFSFHNASPKETVHKQAAQHLGFNSQRLGSNSRRSRQYGLKLARSGRAGQTARIAVVLDDIPTGRLAPDFDIWDMSNDDIRKATEVSSLRGETILVVDTGRAAIDGIHVVWNKNRRKIPNGSGAEMWEFAYEGIRDSKYLTIRLTSVGNQNWFASNQAVFSDFIRTLHLKAD